MHGRSALIATLLTTLVAVLACASGDRSVTGYTDTVALWRGQDANTLIRTWGAPTSQSTMPNGNTLYVYARHGELKTDKRLDCRWDTTTQSEHCSVSGGEEIPLTCQTEFEVDASQRVVFTRASGTMCLVAAGPPATPASGGATQTLPGQAGAAPATTAPVPAAPSAVPQPTLTEAAAAPASALAVVLDATGTPIPASAEPAEGANDDAAADEGDDKPAKKKGRKKKHHK